MKEEIKLRTGAMTITIIALVIIVVSLGLVFHNMKSVSTQIYIDTARVYSKTFIPDRAPHYLINLEYKDEIYQSTIDKHTFDLAYPDQKILVQVVDYIIVQDMSLYDRNVSFYEFKED